MTLSFLALAVIVFSYVCKNLVVEEGDKYESTISKPSATPAEIHAFFVAVLAETGIRVTGFKSDANTISIFGEAENPNFAGRFGGRLFSDQRLADYNWTWQRRPERRPGASGKTVPFIILGTLKQVEEH